MTPFERLVIELLRMILRMVAALYFAGAGHKIAQTYLEEYIIVNEECAGLLKEDAASTTNKL